MQWPRPVEGQPQEPATLVLRVEGPAALEIQHSSDVILQRVNRFFGWSAVGRLALRQAPLSRRKRPAPPPRAGPEGGGGGRRNPVRGRGRGTARRAGAARRRDQAKLSLLRSAPGATRHCHNWRFKLAKASFRTSFGRERAIREQTLMITRRAFTAALSLTGLGRPRRLLAAAADHATRWRSAPPTSPSRSRCPTWRLARPTPR